jgi:hypothetical protein
MLILIDIEDAVLIVIVLAHCVLFDHMRLCALVYIGLDTTLN